MNSDIKDLLVGASLPVKQTEPSIRSSITIAGLQFFDHVPCHFAAEEFSRRFQEKMYTTITIKDALNSLIFNTIMD